MADKIKIGAGISLDGEKEFRQAVTGINSDIKVLASEMKKVSAEFSDNKDSVDALSAKDEVLNKQLDKQKEKVDALKLALQNSQEQYGENDTKTDKWKISLNNAEAELANLDKELKTNKQALEDAKNPVDNLGNELDDMGKNADDAGKKMISMGDIIKANIISTAIIDGVKNLADKFASLAGDALDSADSIQEMADKSGMSAESIQEWTYVGDTVGTSIETITGAQVKLTKSMANAQDGSDKYVSAFKTLGVSVTDSNGNLRDANTVMTEAFEALGKVGNETERNALGMQIFGKSFTNLNPLVKAGSDQIAELTQQAKDNGAVMSNEAVSGLDNFGDTIGQLQQSFTAMAGTILSQLTPSLQPLLEKLKGIDVTPITNGLKFIIDNAGTIVAGLAAIGTGLLAFNAVTMIQGVVEAIKAFQLANEGATIAQWALNAAQSANPIGLVVAAIAALVAGVVVLWNTNDGFRDAVIGAATKIKDTVLGVANSAKTFFTETIPGAFNSFMTFLKENWSGILLLILNPFAGAFKLAYDNSETFRKNIDAFTGKIKDLITNMATGMINGVKELPTKFADVGTKLVKGLWTAISDLAEWINTNTGGFALNIVTSFADGLITIKTVGEDLVKGLWNGISNMADWIKSKIQGFGSGVLDDLKDFFGIHSPSRKMRDEVGIYLAQGIGVGFVEEMENVSNDINKSIPTSFDMNGNYNIGVQSSSGITGSSVIGNPIIMNFYPQTLTEEELDLAFTYVNRRFGLEV